MHITSHILYRFNKVTVNTVIINDGNYRDDMVFRLAVPNDAFISNFTMKMKGDFIRSRIVQNLKNALTDNNQYNPVNYDLRPRGTSFFQFHVQAPPKTEVEFSLVYEELLIRRGGEYEPTFYLHPGNVVDDFEVTVKIQELRPLVNLKVPPIKGELLSSFDDSVQNDMVTISKPNEKTAIITMRASRLQQMKESQDGLKGLLTINYDTKRGKDAGDMLIFNGYFLHFFAPSHFETLPRDIVFVLDDSGSMANSKLEQMKLSLFKILYTLTEKDRIHFIQFSDLINPRKEGFVEVTPESIKEAINYVETEFVAQGGTNINDAILKGFESFRDLPQSDEARARMLIFLTDGQATAGETNREKILKNFQSSNMYNVTVFAIGFGADADFALMKRISFEHKGIACRVYDAKDANTQMYKFFQQIAKILLLGINFDYDSSYIDRKTITMFGDGNYYSGSEMGVIGKFRRGYQGDIDVKVNELRNGRSIKVKDLGKVKVQYDPPMFMTETEYKMMVERMWAFMSVKSMMRNLYMRKYENNFRENYKQLRTLSLKYHFLNSLTKMQLDLPIFGGLSSKFIDINPDYQRDNYAMSRSGNVEYLRTKRRASGLVYDPHFIVELPTLEFPLCFEVLAKSGQNILLLDDPATGDRITAKVVASKVINKDGHQRTYLGAVKIAHSMLSLYVTPRMIRVHGILLSWLKETSMKINGMKLVVTGSGKHLNVYINNSTHIVIQRTLVSHTYPKRVSFLNFYITDYSGLSSDTTGLLGQFAHTDIYSKKSKQFQMLSNAQELYGNDGNGRNFKLDAKLIERLELFDSRSTKPCWKIPVAEDSVLFSGKNMKNFFVKSL
ncbi:inter-alpha-trypsin inhibitor heavy chain H5 [Octopus bimaculoides]|uniref:VWFA domain-containing protein n=1 Tax=Octopus bimaculoides TaxID=37653 RepID=A0A0L8HZL9_OCTBM|nr:inter-alpha-trypsin inhibitor heavy chain H5 [Octopus bimaculoides]|eukprot:XP_014768327.1 PREDICTED: inter-alpha-trypsin inhibitor heavy chain H5-like [Octopus bimaculoides]